MNQLLTIIIGLIFVGILGTALFYGLRKQDTADCYKWRDELKEYPLYYVTEAQINQCNYLEITIK